MYKPTATKESIQSSVVPLLSIEGIFTPAWDCDNYFNLVYLAFQKTSVLSSTLQTTALWVACWETLGGTASCYATITGMLLPALTEDSFAPTLRAFGDHPQFQTVRVSIAPCSQQHSISIQTIWGPLLHEDRHIAYLLLRHVDVYNLSRQTDANCDDWRIRIVCSVWHHLYWWHIPYVAGFDSHEKMGFCVMVSFGLAGAFLLLLLLLKKKEICDFLGHNKINVVNVNFFVKILLIELYLFIQLPVTVTIF